MGVQAGDRILAIDGAADRRSRRTFRDIDLGLAAATAVTLRRPARRPDVTLGPTRPEQTNGVYRLGFVLRGEGLVARPRRSKESVLHDGERLA